MAKANVKIVARWPRKQRGPAYMPSGSMPASPCRRWLAFLILIPVMLAALILTLIFFSAVLAFCLIGGVGFSLWMWWLGWKLSKSAQSEGLKDGYVVIKEPRIESKAVKKRGQ